jgi:prevent-host-death family protein
MIIKPASELRNNFTGISRIVHDKNEPIFLTRNGSGDMVVMSMEQYNASVARLELYEKLTRSEADSDNNRVRPWEEVKTFMVQKTGE